MVQHGAVLDEGLGQGVREVDGAVGAGPGLDDGGLASHAGDDPRPGAGHRRRAVTGRVIDHVYGLRSDVSCRYLDQGAVREERRVHGREGRLVGRVHGQVSL